MRMNTLPVAANKAIRMGAEANNTQQMQRELSLDSAESALKQAEVQVKANEAPLETAQKNLEQNQAQVDKARAQLSQSKAQIDGKQSQVSNARVDDSASMPSFGSAQRGQRGTETMNMKYVYAPEQSSSNETSNLLPGVNPDIMNQINRREPTVSAVDPAATQIDKQPPPPDTTVEITSPTQAALTKTEPDNNDQRLSTLEIDRPKRR